MTDETIAIAGDHAGLELKNALAEQLRGLGYSVLDLGTNSADSVDYPDFADKMADALRDGPARRGVLVCGVDGAAVIDDVCMTVLASTDR